MAYKVNELTATLLTGRWNFDPTQGTILTDFQAGHGFTTSGADPSSNVNDTSTFTLGSQCATVVSAGTGASAILQNTSVTTTDTTNLQVALVLMCPDTTHLSTIDFSVGNSGGFSNEYHVQFGSQVNLSSGSWQVVTLSFGDAVTQGSPTRTGINAARLFFKDDSTGNKVTVHWQAIWFMPNAATQKGAPFPSGVASVCFDDGFATAWATAKPYLDASGLRASAFIIKDVLGGSGRMTLPQVQALQDQAGWEVNAHAYTDADHSATDTGISTGELTWDLSSEKEWLRVNGLNGQGFAYPLGQANPSVVAVARQWFRYARGTQQLTETYPPGDPYRVKGISSISEFTGGVSPALISQAGGKIDQAVANASWLILTFHNVIPAVTSVTMSGNIATIVFAGALPTTATWKSAQTIILAGFTPSGLNGTFTIASVVNSTTITVNIGSNPGNSTIQGTAVTATTDCSFPGYTAIIDKLNSSGIAVMPVAEAFSGGQALTPSFPVGISGGGTGAVTQQGAINNLAGSQTSGQYLRGSGANVQMSAIQAADLPWTATPAANQLGPADHGLIAWNFIPYNIRSSDKITLTPGTLYVAKIPVPYATAIGTIGYDVVQAASAATTGQNFAGLYSSSGTLLSASADQTTNFGAAVSHLAALGTTSSVSAGYVYAGFVFNGSGTALALAAGDAPSSLLNFNRTAATSLWATSNTGLTTALPGTFSALTGVSNGIWACLA